MSDKELALRARLKYLLYQSAPQEYNADEIRHIKEQILEINPDADDRDFYAHPISVFDINVPVPEPAQKERAAKQARPARRIAVGALVAVAACLTFVTVSTNGFTSAGPFTNGFVQRFKTKQGELVITPPKSETDRYGLGNKIYTDFTDVPSQYRAFIWRYEHPTLVLQDISVFKTESKATVTSRYTDDDSVQYLNLVFDIYSSNNDSVFRSEAVKDYDPYESIHPFSDDREVTIYRKVSEDDVEYLAQFDYDGRIYKVQSNLSIGEIKALASDYMDFAYS